jgi:hypothetical protein
VSTQLDLFGEAKVEVEKPETPTPVRAGSRVVQVNLSKRRRKALNQFMEVLAELEGKDVYIGSYFGPHSHFWINHLKLGRMQIETFTGGDKLPAVVVLWGSRGASVRIFTDQVKSLRRQKYQGYTLWLLDFWNGFGEHPIDPYRPRGYVSLDIVRFKD